MRRYPWAEWEDGSVWEIRQGVDYDVSTENMRINLHMRADLALKSVETRKLRDEAGEGLVFQFTESPESLRVRQAFEYDREATKKALRALYSDARDAYQRAGQEVTIERKDGITQMFLASRYLEQLERGSAEDLLVPTIASMIRNRNRGSGFAHLSRAGRPDLMLEALIVDGSRPYSRLFTAKIREISRKRLSAFE
jgi:hypothetical protein